MIIHNVPVLKTEAGVHTASPGTPTDVNTHVLVGGILTPKKAREVMIKFITGAWVIQSVYSTGTRAALETTNPATSQTAFLSYPLNDFLNFQACCAQPDA